MANISCFLAPPSRSYFLFGPCGTGKTTFLENRYSGAVWVNLLAPEVEREYIARPERLRALVEANLR